MSWQPIEDLPPNWQDLASSELPPLVTVWDEQADRLRQSGELRAFNEKLRREIAIETGIIERLYTIDRGITLLLIEQGINEALIPYGTTDRPAKKIVSLIKDQETAIEGLFGFVRGQRKLSTSYVKELHQVLTRHQETTEAKNPLTQQIVDVPLLRGDWKKEPNHPSRPEDGNIIKYYCPPEQVASEMDRLIELHHQHSTWKVPPEIQSAWLHHRFTQIHPFQDGNGRVARCLASLVFIQASWFPLVLTRLTRDEHRERDRAIYIAALEKADQGELSWLVDLFAKSQKQSFLRALGLSQQVLSEQRRANIIISSIAEKLKQNQSASIQDRCKKAEEFAVILFDRASTRFQELAQEIKSSVEDFVDDAQVFTVSSPADDPRSYYHRYQVVETAKYLDYFANIRSYHAWIQLVINVETSTTILLSFHVLGHEFRGLLVCTACAYHRDRDESGEGERSATSIISDIQSLTDSLFQFSYADDEESLIERFKQWLEEIILTGLEYWNKSI